MSKIIENTFSFWELINRYKIEIPIIQRDYAQGRDNAKAKAIREQITKNMLSALSNGGMPLSFDFIYGRVADGMFIPIDGQQRLTTLWLLHVYLFKRCANLHNETCGKDCPHFKSATLSRFTYTTRQSSREFCEIIVLKDILDLKDELSITAYITNQPWFYPDWTSDPTVAGMLRTLDCIDDKIKNKATVPEMLEKLLKDTCPITFQFLDMEGHGLTDDIYLKMNARGLPLTEFENFKASLEKYLSENLDSVKPIVDNLKPKDEDDATWDKISDDNCEKKIAWKLEHDWHDVFWNKDSPDPIETEQQMLSLFRRHFLNTWRLKKEDDDTSKTLSPPINSDSFTPFSVYESVLKDIGIEPAFQPVVNLFEALAFYGKDIIATAPSWPEDPWDALEGKWGRDHEDFTSRVRFYAVLKCFETPIVVNVGSDSTFKSAYTEWMRVVWNILGNMSATQKNYQSFLSLFAELGAHWNNIIDWLANDKNKIKSEISKKQVQEEREKAKKLVALQNAPASDGVSREAIIKAESIFKGTIRFLYLDEEGNANWDNFIQKSNNAAKFFTSDGLEKDQAVEFVTAIIKLIPSYIGSESYLFTKDLRSWKELFSDDRFHELNHNIFSEENLLPLKPVPLNPPQESIKDQLLREGVIEYLLEHYINARFTWKDNWFRLYARYQQRPEHILFDAGDSQRHEKLSRCLKDFNLEIENEQIANSTLFIGETITMNIKKGHNWCNPSWEARWWNGYGKDEGWLFFEHPELDTNYVVDVWRVSDDIDKEYSINFFRRDEKTENDKWIEKLKGKLPFTLKGTRYWLEGLSVKETEEKVAEIINTPFETKSTDSF